jgi:hypothetical protein
MFSPVPFLIITLTGSFHLSRCSTSSIEMKQMSRSYGLAEVLHQIIPQLQHGNDGLIFSPVDVPYQPGTCSKLLKWKPAWLNSVDFVVHVATMAVQPPVLVFELFIGCQGSLEFVDLLTPEVSLMAHWTMQSPHGRIAECRYDPSWDTFVPANFVPSASYALLPAETNHKPSTLLTDNAACPSTCPPGFVARRGGWRFLRFRDDKHTPNDKSVMEKIFLSIKDDVTPQDLLARMPVVRANWKAREQKMQSR